MFFVTCSSVLLIGLINKILVLPTFLVQLILLFLFSFFHSKEFAAILSLDKVVSSLFENAATKADYSLFGETEFFCFNTHFLLFLFHVLVATLFKRQNFIFQANCKIIEDEKPCWRKIFRSLVFPVSSSRQQWKPTW